MNFNSEKIDDIFYCRVLLERATMKDAPDFRVFMDNHILDGEYKIIIDLYDCTFIDSSFLGVLVQMLKKLNKINGNLKLIGFQPAVRSMFELTRMFNIFETYSDKQSALSSFANG